MVLEELLLHKACDIDLLILNEHKDAVIHGESVNLVQIKEVDAETKIRKGMG
jgi:hypothetical protein